MALAQPPRGQDKYGDGGEYELSATAEPLYDVDAQASIVDWRVKELERAGCTTVHATALAVRRDVDLHAACDMLKGGATSEQVALILL
jgi:hypothetical protein